MTAARDSDPIDHDSLRHSLNETPYCRALGVVVESIDEKGVRIALPFADQNANPGNALHGGCAASLAAIGSRAVARTALAADSGPWVLGQLQVNYLSAAIGEDVVADARLQRRGRTLCFVETSIATRDGKAIASATAVVRARCEGKASALRRSSLPTTFGDEGGDNAGPLAPILEKAAFMAARGMRIENMENGISRVTMPESEANAAEDGRQHDGAILALLDTAGAMAAWSEAGPAAWKASTASIHAQSLAPPPRGAVVAYSRCIHRDREMYWCDTEVVDPTTEQVTTRGTVFYRLAE